MSHKYHLLTRFCGFDSLHFSTRWPPFLSSSFLMPRGGRSFHGRDCSLGSHARPGYPPAPSSHANTLTAIPGMPATTSLILHKANSHIDYEITRSPSKTIQPTTSIHFTLRPTSEELQTPMDLTLCRREYVSTGNFLSPPPISFRNS